MAGVDEPMDWTNVDTSKVYPVSPRCDYKRLAVVIYMTENKSPYGIADLRLLENLWRLLKFRVIAIRDPSLSDLEKAVNDILAEIDRNSDDHDMLCVCFIGHGGRDEQVFEGRIYTYEFAWVKDGVIEIDKLRAMFTTVKCKGLSGLPKLFFAQLCRGKNSEIPSELDAAVEMVTDNSDCLIVNACISGYRAIYNRKIGQSAFMNTLCTVFEREYTTEDVLSMATCVVNEIKDKRQTPEPKSTLRKKLYFSGVKNDILPRFIRHRVDLKLQNQTPTAYSSLEDRTSNELYPNVQARVYNLYSRPHKQEKGLEIRKVILKVDHRDETNKVQRLSLGRSTNKPTKVILLVGATGVGKTTLINTMANYLFGVEFNNNYRYILIDDRVPLKKSETVSQTEWITAYALNHIDGMPFEYNYLVIDTPGFGDSRGIHRDCEMMQQLEMFLKQSYGIDYVDAVGLVTPASAGRLTQTQKYVYEGLASMLGRDVQDNVFVMATFADAKTPPVLGSLEDACIKYSGYFKFNNSCLYAINQKIEDTDSEDSDSEHIFMASLFWGMGYKSMHKFLTRLVKTSPPSLGYTKLVLKERRELDCSMIVLVQHIQLGLAKTQNLNMERDMLRRCEDDMKGSENYEEVIEVPKITKVELPYGTYILNCLKCNFTCNYPCYYPDDESKRHSSVMTNGYCRVCPDKCFWDMHKSLTFRYDNSWVQETRTIMELKDRYNSAKEGRSAKEKCVKAIEADINDSTVQLKEIIKNVQQNVEKLEEIALKPFPLSSNEYLCLMIESEKMQKRPNYEKRVNLLENLKIQVAILNAVQRGLPNFSGEKLLTYFQTKMHHSLVV